MAINIISQRRGESPTPNYRPMEDIALQTLLRIEQASETPMISSKEVKCSNDLKQSSLNQLSFAICTHDRDHKDTNRGVQGYKYA